MTAVVTAGAGAGRLRRAPGTRARIDAQVRLAAGAALWTSLLLVSYWWVSDRGIQDLSGWASGLTSVGRISGLVASVLLLAQVILMARVPLLEKGFGQDKIAGLHRLVGFWSFNLMVLHVVAITWGYAGGSVPSFVPTLWNLTVDDPGMLLAAAATICLVMVVATSIKAARKRLRYESWHLMHLYAYLGVGLALPHQLWTGQQFVGSPTKTVFWWTTWAAAAAAVLVWRLGVPVALNLRHRLRVAEVVEEGPNVWSVYVTGSNLDRLRVEAGQFFSWRFLAGPGWTRANPYSLSAEPTASGLRISVQGVGDGSLATRYLQPGTRVIVEGPFGRLSERARTRRKLAFIGAGVGTAPLRALAAQLDYAPGDAVYLERFTADPLFESEIDALAQRRGLRVYRLLGPRRSADSWLCASVGTASDLRALTHWIPDIAERDVYLCGPEPWTDLVRATLAAANHPDDQLHLETFAW